MGSTASSQLLPRLAQKTHRRNALKSITGNTKHKKSWGMALMSGPRYSRAHDKSQATHLFMDMLTRLMMTLPSTRSALRAERRPSHL